MLYYVAKRFTITANGSRLREVTCEKCATPFQYQLSRARAGAASAPYYLFQAAAKLRAERRAEKLLAKALDRDSEMVPCPSCRWINLAAIRQFRKSRFRSLHVFAIVLAAAGLLIMSMLYANYVQIFHKPLVGFPIQLQIALAATLGPAALLLALQMLLRRRINPNVHSDGHPRVPPGTPPALLRNADSGQTLSVPSEHPDVASQAQWATFRAGQLVFEPLCCQCLAPATDIYKMPMTLNKELLEVPLCNPCLRQLRRKWILRLVLSFLVAGAIAWGISLFARDVDFVGRVLMAIFITFILGLISFAFIDRSMRPYRIEVVDADRGVSRVGFNNPVYTAILIRRLGERDGMFQK